MNLQHWVYGRFLVNTRRSPNAVLVLAHRLRRWPNTKTALDNRLVFAWLYGALLKVFQWGVDRHVNKGDTLVTHLRATGTMLDIVFMLRVDTQATL